MVLSPTPQKFLVIAQLHIIIAKNTCLHLDGKVNFNHHINKKISKANKRDWDIKELFNTQFTNLFN